MLIDKRVISMEAAKLLARLEVATNAVGHDFLLELLECSASANLIAETIDGIIAMIELNRINAEHIEDAENMASNEDNDSVKQSGGDA